MNELDKIRQKIDEIDAELVPLFEKRLGLALQVAEYKKKNNLEIMQSGRESEVLKKAVDCLSDKSFSAETQDFMTMLMDISKDTQRAKFGNVGHVEISRSAFEKSAKKGYFGEVGSNSEQAMQAFFGDYDGVMFSKFEDVFKAIDSGQITYGVVPIENSSTGAITDVYDLLDKYNLFIIGEQWERIDNKLWGISGSSLSDIKTVYSHPQAIAQCKDFLEQRSISAKPFSSTSASVKLLENCNDKTVGAIASQRAGNLYGATLLADGINTNKDNFTRFIVIAKTLTTCDANKVSIQFALKNTAGALFNVLKYFAKYNINMVMIESRPIKNNPCNYYFYIDMEGNCRDGNMSSALDFIKSNSVVFKLLGEYAKGELK